MDSPAAATESGFSLVEVTLALMVSALAAVMFVSASSSTNRLSSANRGMQEATSIAADHIESARGLPWETLAMSEFDDSAPLLVEGTQVLDGEAAGVPADEPLVVSASGAIDPSGVVERDAMSFQTWSYVTSSFYTSDVIRFVVLVAWDTGEDHHERVFSTLISDVTAGAGTTTTTPATTTTTVPADGCDEGDDDGDDGDDDDDCEED